MRSTTRRALATVAIAGILPLTAASAAHAETTTTHETGHVVECLGTWKGQPVVASLYENSEFGNEVSVHVGEHGDEVGANRTTDEALLVDGEVATGLRLDGRRVRLLGGAERYGKRIAVHEEHDDAGQHIVVDGFHKRLATDLTMTWKQSTVPLTCDTAFFYDLVVEKTPTS